MKHHIIFLLFITLINLNSYSQSRWVQHYMDNFNSPGLDLNIAYDNGYLLSGWITPNYPPYTGSLKLI